MEKGTGRRALRPWDYYILPRTGLTKLAALFK